MSVSGDKVCVCVCVWGRARESERENLTLESFASLISERTWFIKWCERAVWAKHGSHTERLSLCFSSINSVFFANEKIKRGPSQTHLSPLIYAEKGVMGPARQTS